MESFPLQVRVVVSGELGDGCTELNEIVQEREGNTFNVTITTARPAEAVCTQLLQLFEESIALDVEGLPAGEYIVDVNGVTGTFVFEQDNFLEGE
jgi:inhibitor of cysteine peptidase